ncbi:hypothetical protein LZ30DRAFT_298434 [Colletotrichum cereale]|nr:hypothetical protein LZ30DRAFT_298434 [Colletotrichum cereale]
MPSNGFSPYTVPYSGVVGTANFVPGAAAHPPASQDKYGQGGFRLPTVAEEPVAAETAHSKGESMALGAAGGPPRDAIPARFASAGVSAASGGIAIVPGDLCAGGFPSSSDACAASGLGQMSHQKKEQPKGFNLNIKARLPFGTDGQDDDEGMPPSPTTMTMSAKRHSDRALPVIARELKAVKAENDRLRNSNHRLQVKVASNDVSSQLLESLQSSNEQLKTQVESLYKQMSDLQKQAQEFSCDRDRLQKQLINTELSLEELVELIVRLENIISRIDPDVFVTFPFEVQELLGSVHEEWKYLEYCKLFKPQRAQEDDDSSVSTIVQPQNAVRDKSLSLIIGTSYASATVSSAILGDTSFYGSDNDEPSHTENAPATASSSDTVNSSSGINNDMSNAELLRQLFQDLAVSGPNTKGSSQQTPQRTRPAENLLDFSSPGTPSSIGTPRTVYSSASETAQGTHVTHDLQIYQTAHVAQDGQGAGSTETTQGMMATNTVNVLDYQGIHIH